MSPSKKIVFVNFSSGWGGGEVQHFELAKEFDRQGHKAILLTSKNSELKKRAKLHGISTQSLNIKKLSFLSPFTLFAIRTILKKVKPDGIILNSSLELKHLAIATSKKKYNLIYRRGFHAKIKASRLNRFLFRRLTTVVANSEFIMRSALGEISKNCNIKPVVINNGIPPMEINYTPDYATNNIVAMGRLVKYKQFNLLIQAMPVILKSNSSAKLTIVGDGKEFQNLQQLIKQLNLQNNVELIGFSDDIQKYLRKSSLFVHPAEYEAFGVVLLEAMRQKLSCVAFSGHASDEIILHNKTGLLVPTMTSEALGGAIVKQLNSQKSLEEMGSKAFDRFIQNFTIDISVQKFLTLLNQN